MEIPFEALLSVLGVVGSIAGAAVIVGRDRQQNETTRERVAKLEKRDEVLLALQIEIGQLRASFQEYTSRAWPTHERRVESIESSLRDVIPRLASIEATLKEH